MKKLIQRLFLIPLSCLVLSALALSGSAAVAGDFAAPPASGTDDFTAAFAVSGSPAVSGAPVCAPSVTAPASRTSGVRRATVQGHGTVTAPATLARVCLRVESRALSSAAAKAENDALTETVRSLCRDVGTLSEVSLDSYCCSYEGNEAYVCRMLELSVPCNGVPDNLTPVLNSLLSEGVSLFGGVTYSVSDDSGAQHDALCLAVADAFAKAEALGLSADAVEITECTAAPTDFGCCPMPGSGGADGTVTVGADVVLTLVRLPAPTSQTGAVE